MDEARRVVLEREVRERVAAGKRRTFLVHVQERHGGWTITVPDIPHLRAQGEKRQSLGPAAAELISAALSVPPSFFDLHFRFDE